jgi:hypothetical protein
MVTAREARSKKAALGICEQKLLASALLLLSTPVAAAAIRTASHVDLAAASSARGSGKSSVAACQRMPNALMAGIAAPPPVHWRPQSTCGCALAFGGPLLRAMSCHAAWHAPIMRPDQPTARRRPVDCLCRVCRLSCAPLPAFVLFASLLNLLYTRCRQPSCCAQQHDAWRIT